MKFRTSRSYLKKRFFLGFLNAVAIFILLSCLAWVSVETRNIQEPLVFYSAVLGLWLFVTLELITVTIVSYFQIKGITYTFTEERIERNAKKMQWMTYQGVEEAKIYILESGEVSMIKIKSNRTYFNMIGLENMDQIYQLLIERVAGKSLIVKEPKINRYSIKTYLIIYLLSLSIVVAGVSVNMNVIGYISQILFLAAGLYILFGRPMYKYYGRSSL